MITFLHPFAFVWLALAVPLILFYIWRARRPQMQVVTGALWRKAIPLLHPRRAWQKQRWGVSLLVQLAILFVLVTALAEPVWRRPQRVVLVLDGTVSMSTKNADGQSRFEEAAAKARALVENMGYVDSMAVLTAGNGIGIHSRMSHDRKQILASLDSLPATGGTAPVDEAVEMAKSLIKAGTGGTFDSKTNHVILISDGCFPMAERVLADPTVRWIPVGQSLGNVYMETLSAERRTPEKPENAEIFSALRNFGSQSVQGILTISVWKEGESVPTNEQKFEVEIPAREKGGLLTQSVTIPFPQAARIHARFQPNNPVQNALTCDDSAETVLQEAFVYRVLVVTLHEKNTLLENVLNSLPGIQVETKILKKSTRLTEKALAEFAAESFTLNPAGVKQFQLVIFDRTLPPKSFFKAASESSFEAESSAEVESSTRTDPNSKAESSSVQLPFLCFAPPADSLYWKRSETVRDYVIMPWMDGLRNGISTAGVGFTGTHALVPDSSIVNVSAWLFSQSALETNENQNATEEDENFAKQAKTVEMTELCWGLEPGTAPRCVLAACDLTQSDWILADDFPRFLQYAFDWLIHTTASTERLTKGVETAWNPGDSFTDADLQLPQTPEKIFEFPAEDLIPFWSILALIVCSALVVEWYFYQRRWIE